MIDPARFEAEAEAVRARADGYRNDRDLVDLSRVETEAERLEIENQLVDDFLGTVQADRSTGVGRAFNWLSGILVAGRGSFVATNSEFAQVRAVGQLMNPEMINGRSNRNVWVTDQMAVSHGGADLSKAVTGFAW